jgi:hypothetical protein
MKEETIFHIKVDYEEAVEAKRDMLSSERDFINILKIMRKYNALRQKELDNKLKIHNKIRDLKINLRKITDILPKIKIPDILKKRNLPEKEEVVVEEKLVKVEPKTKEAIDEDELEKQLKEIQERLSKLG